MRFESGFHASTCLRGGCECAQLYNQQYESVFETTCARELKVRKLKRMN